MCLYGSQVNAAYIFISLKPWHEAETPAIFIMSRPLVGQLRPVDEKNSDDQGYPLGALGETQS